MKHVLCYFESFGYCNSSKDKILKEDFEQQPLGPLAHMIHTRNGMFQMQVITRHTE